MKAKVDKISLLVSSDESCTAQIEDFSFKNSTEEKLLGVKFDFNLWSLCQITLSAVIL